MKIIKFFRYFIEFIIIIFFFIIFKILRIRISTFISGKIFTLLGPLFRSKKIISENLVRAFPNITDIQIKKKIFEMWNYYGKIFAEYPFLNNFRNEKFSHSIKVVGNDVLDDLKIKNENVIFVSGHFDNFELMAMTLEKKGIKLAVIYRPLNNFFMNKIMEYLRIKYICKNQIKKGRSSVRNLLTLFKNGSSIALMIDQRVSEGVKSKFFGKEAYTTTIPAQFVKKFNCRVVPIYIERVKEINFKLTVFKPLKFEKNDSVEKITLDLNIWLEKTLKNNSTKWIWSHDRWK
jgi:Kdo2-lipid IVA lauroyltransferase/acyltransferase